MYVPITGLSIEDLCAHYLDIALSVQLCLGRWKSGRIGHSSSVAMAENPNLNEQKIVSELMNSPVNKLSEPNVRF